jgi:hypothetical protein
MVTAAVVDSPATELQKLLTDHQREESAVARQRIEEFARRFQEMHKLRIRCTDSGMARLITIAAELHKPIREVCAERFKDYEFGLKLIAQNTGEREFVVDESTVDAPDKMLNDWVVASYRSNGAQAGSESNPPP